MKKILYTTLLSVICSLAVAQHNYTLKFNLDDFKFEEHNGVLVIKSINEAPCFSEDTKAPAIPYLQRRILRNTETQAEGIKINYTKQLIYKNVDIAANPRITSTDKDYVRTSRMTKADKSSSKPVLFCFDSSMYGFQYSFLKYHHSITITKNVSSTSCQALRSLLQIRKVIRKRNPSYV